MLFSIEELDNRINKKKENKTAVVFDAAISESLTNFASFSEDKEYDIFLSHSSLDETRVAVLAEELREFGFSIYLDWREDPQLDRSNVTKETAETLRKRMKNCKCLLYAQSINSQRSRWMPWETGFMDGLKERVAIVPLVQKIVEGKSDSFSGQEYLSLYPYITKSPSSKTGENVLWVNDKYDIYCTFREWVLGEKKPYNHNK